MSWQPIETAEEVEDMLDVLLCDANCAVVGWRDGINWLTGEGLYFHPTHWMHIPNRPTA